MSTKRPSVNTALKTIREYMGLYTDYRKPKAIEAFNRLQEELKVSKQKYDELFRMTESYIKRLHTAEEENKRLREALQMISNGMDISDHDPLKEQIVGYFRGIAEAALKNGG